VGSERMKSNLSVHHKKSKRKKNLSLLQVISSVEPTITIEDKTEEINPSQLSVPFLHTKEADIGIANIEGKKSVYLRLFFEG